MKQWRHLFIGLLSTLVLPILANEPQRVYMFGVATNFNDSTVYITDIQHIDSMVINPDGSLQNYVGYSLQLKVYLEGSLNERNQTCAVIYSNKKRQLEKRFSAVRKRHEYDNEKTFKQISTDVFTFQKR